jgi:hypothetical protein
MKSLPDEFGMAWAAVAPSTAPATQHKTDSPAVAAIAKIRSRFTALFLSSRLTGQLCAHWRRMHTGKNDFTADR